MIEQTALTRTIRHALYNLKRQYGGTISVYRQNDVSVDRRTGVKSVVKDVFVIDRAVVLPVRISREVLQSISQISHNKKFVMGGNFVVGQRLFILDARDLPCGFVLGDDDWIVYRNRRYDIKSLTEFELDAGWVIVGHELPDVRPEQVFPLATDDLIRISDTAAVA